jgi:WD40 repeat protein
MEAHHPVADHSEHEHALESGHGTKLDKTGKVVDRYHKDEAPLGDYSHFEHDAQFMAVRPWAGAIIAPTNLPKVEQAQPASNLKIDYVYGYRSLDSRQNVFYTSNPNEIVYMTAALGIVLNTTTNTQRILGGGEKTSFKGHNDDITALAISTDKKTVVTGSVGKNPQICVWDVEAGTVTATFNQGIDTKAVRGLSISADGKMIASVAGDETHTVFLFDIVTGKSIASSASGPDPVMDISFSHEIKDGTYELATVGKNGVQFFTWNGKALEHKKGIFGSHKMADMWSVAWLSTGKCVTGSTTGSVYLWDNHSCTKDIPCHTGIVSAITVGKGLIVTGGKDNQVHIYDDHWVKKSSVDVGSNAKGLDINPTNGNVIAGLRNGTIVEIDSASNVKTLMKSHSDGELWGLVICPHTGFVITTCDDNKILVWDSKERKCVAEGIINEKAGIKPKTMGASTLSPFPPNQMARSVAINPTNGNVAIGLNDGQLSVRESTKEINKVIATKTDAKEWIEAMSYSPCGKFLAVGSHDNNVYVYDVSNSYHLVSKFHKQTSFITSLDWSTDSKNIQSISGSYELLFSEAATGHHLTDGATQLKDEEWSNWTCKLGWPVQGIFPAGVEGSHINGVDRSKKRDLVATGDDWRLVNVHRYPCLHGVKPKSYVGHSEHVVRVRFDEKDEYLYSIGGFDRTLIQWKLA